MANFSLLAKLGLDSKAFQRGLSVAKKKLSGFKRGLMSVKGALLTLGGIRTAKTFFELGASAEETASKFRAVFGPAADKVNEKIKEMMKTIPATEAEMQDLTATIATMTQAMGLPPGLAADLSVEMVKLGGDIASFNNMKPEEVFTKLRAALSGEFEPLKQLGVVINEARIKQEALNLGIGDGTKKLTAAQKSLVVYNILLNDTVKMQGDAAATADSTANKVKFLVRDLKEIGTTIGEFVLPQIQAFARGLEIISNQMKKLKPPEAIKEAANDFEEMARQNLQARGELEMTRKFVVGGTMGGMMVDDPAAIRRNQERIRKRAAELRKSYEVLPEEEKKLFDGIQQSNDATEEGNELREEQRKQYEVNRDLINEGLEGLDFAADVPSNKKKMSKGAVMGGISSLAAIGGGGRVGKLIPVEQKQLDESKIQTKVLNKIEKNTSKQTTSKFK